METEDNVKGQWMCYRKLIEIAVITALSQINGSISECWGSAGVGSTAQQISKGCCMWLLGTRAKEATQRS